MAVKLKLENIPEELEYSHVMIRTDEALCPKLEIYEKKVFPFRGFFVKFRGYLGAEGYGKGFMRVCYTGITSEQDMSDDINNVLALLFKVLRQDTPDNDTFLDIEFSEKANIHYSAHPSESRNAEAVFDYRTSKPVLSS